MKLNFLIYLVYLFWTPNCFSDFQREEFVREPQERKIFKAIPYASPNKKGGNIYFAEHFDDRKEFEAKWVVSRAKKPKVSENLAQYNGKWDLLHLEKLPLENDTGLVLVTEGRHAAIVAKFDKPFVFDGTRPFIVQYVVNFQKPVDCGGAYLKLLTDGSLSNLALFNDKTPYTIMFGPDKCGNNYKMHFIIRHKNPINGNVVEKHCTKLKANSAMFKNQESHLLKLFIKPDNDYAFYINDDLQYQGNLLNEKDFSPSINLPKEIVDINDTKPENWDDRKQIPDPTAVKPNDWNEDEAPEIPDPVAVKPKGWLENEPLSVPDKYATKPEDWDDEMDGEWEAPVVENPRCKSAPGCGPWNPPMIKNPKYKGKWSPPMIDNVNYKGQWAPRKIPNPDYYYDETPLKSSPIGYIGFELWSLVNNIYFDDILVTDDEFLANEWAEKTWVLKNTLDYENMSFYKLFLHYTNEYPWLWGVYVLIAAIIVGLVGSCILKYYNQDKDDFDKELLHKKTDNYVSEYDQLNHRRQSTTTSFQFKTINGDNDSYDLNEKEKCYPLFSKCKENLKRDFETFEREAMPSSPRKRKPRRD